MRCLYRRAQQFGGTILMWVFAMLLVASIAVAAIGMWGSSLLPARLGNMRFDCTFLVLDVPNQHEWRTCVADAAGPAATGQSLVFLVTFVPDQEIMLTVASGPRAGTDLVIGYYDLQQPR